MHRKKSSAQERPAATEKATKQPGRAPQKKKQLTRSTSLSSSCIEHPARASTLPRSTLVDKPDRSLSHTPRATGAQRHSYSGSSLHTGAIGAQRLKSKPKV